MKSKNFNPNSDNVIASNLKHVTFFLFFENWEHWVQKWTSHAICSKRCCECLKNKIPHIV
jgi:hypothetical protein